MTHKEPKRKNLTDLKNNIVKKTELAEKYINSLDKYFISKISDDDVFNVLNICKKSAEYFNFKELSEDEITDQYGIFLFTLNSLNFNINLIIGILLDTSVKCLEEHINDLKKRDATFNFLKSLISFIKKLNNKYENLSIAYSIKTYLNESESINSKLFLFLVNKIKFFETFEPTEDFSELKTKLDSLNL